MGGQEQDVVCLQVTNPQGQSFDGADQWVAAETHAQDLVFDTILLFCEREHDRAR